MHFLSTENFNLIVDLIKQYGDFVRVWLGPELNVVVSDPKDVEVRDNNAIYNAVIERLNSNIRSIFSVQKCNLTLIISVQNII